ncbi:Putative CTR2 short splice variant [[Torrubiella] hemipterigena]|uniref:Copper transport protein n=1 Tax=[Torrubiella] hemipterigena TaxID=1531966 RepID=A0A0A1T8S0_9HYPO|nr:Putative CTR2 short splice variant [[Torrubiella] hemipterigena]
MDHSAMDHSGHGGMPGMDDMCSMSMLFTWDTKNLCIVFRQWHIRSTLSLIISLLAIVLIGVGYEALRALSRSYETASNQRIQSLPRQLAEEASRKNHYTKAAIYALQNFYAFMLMLVFMTYNGWVMIAVTLGAFIGYVLFGHTTSSTKDNACH